MVKSIIKRIIVGVGIALCLYFIKGSLILDVNAQSTNLAPSNICNIKTTTDTCVWSTNMPTYQIYDATFYGGTFPTGATRGRIGWRFFPSDNLKNKTYDIDFLMYLTGSTTYLESNRGYIINDSGNIFTCYIDNTRFGNFGSNSVNSATGSTTVRCDNVYIGNTFNFYLMDFITEQGGTVAISTLTLTDSQTPAIQQEIENVNNSIQETTDTIKDDNVDNNSISGTIQNGSSQIASNNSITQLLTLPISLYQNILNSVGGSCSSFSLGTLYNHQLTLPCINLQNLLGSTLYGIIDILISGLFILSFRKKMVDIFNNMTSLKDRGNELE